MKRCILSVLTAFLIGGLTLLYSGCSLIGLAVGASSDAHKPENRLIKNPEIISIRAGQNITMDLQDKTTLVGKFEGVQPVSAEEYARKYEETRMKNISLTPLPRLGEKVVVEGNDPTDRGEGEFAGFDFGFLRIRNIEKNRVMGVSSKRYPILKNEQGNLFDIKTLNALMLEGKIPVLTEAVVKIGSDKKIIPLEQISEVRIQNKKNAKLKGFLIGATIDVAVILIAASSFSVLPRGWLAPNIIK